MANLRDIRNRIQSVKNTQQITKAMKMVSAAKLRKAQDNIVNCRPYAYKILSMIHDIAKTQEIEHNLLQLKNQHSTDTSKKLLFVVLTSDRGLCGGFNNNLARWAFKKGQDILVNSGQASKLKNSPKENSPKKNSSKKKSTAKYEKTDFYFIGKKAREFFKIKGIDSVGVMENLAKDISYSLAAKVSQKLLDQFASGEYDEIQLIYNEFKSVISQNIVSETLLPLDMESNEVKNQETSLSSSSSSSSSSLGSGGSGGSGGSRENTHSSSLAKDIVLKFEPSAREMIDPLLEKHFAVQIYRAMSESIAAEHAARMTAMENATKNAQEMIYKLTLKYNKARQSSITTELIEITSGAEALKS